MKKEGEQKHLPDFKRLFESAPGLYLVLSPSLEILAASDTYLKATMTKREEIVGRGVFDVFPDNPDDPHATGVGNLHASLKRVLATKVADAMAVQKYDIPKPGGGGFEERYWSPLNSPVLDDNRNVIYIIHQVEDVTDFIRLTEKEREQDKLTRSLQRRQEKMELEIYLRAQQLQAANEKLRESERLKDEFLTNMSHEIRTPMNAIIGFAGLLDKTDLSERQKEFVTAIKDSGQNLLGIINDILDFSRIQSGQIRFENVSFSVRALVDSVHRLLTNKAETKGIGFTVSFDSNIHELLSGDPTRVTQILLNLIGNAIKFTEEGGVKLDVSLKERKGDVRVIQFRVEDTGIGIPAEKVDVIFERFTQASSETTRIYGGTGLGLSIVKRLVELQNGTIELQSELGKGSIFTVNIPFRTVTFEQLQDYNASAHAEESGELNDVRVLIVEDNKMNQRLAIEVLAGFGVISEVAENGKVAIEKLKDGSYDVILMDMQMAEMDGYQATQYIRKTLKNDTPIIAMTAHAMTGEREKCLALGMNDYISKPFKAAELFRKIQTLVAGVQAVKEVVQEEKGRGLMDLSYLERIGSSDPSFVHDMVAIFLADVPKLMEEMGRAVKKEDHEAVGRLAHKMHSSSAMMGIETLTAALARLQERCREGANGMEISETFRKVEADFGAVVGEIQKWREENGSGRK